MRIVSAYELVTVSAIMLSSKLREVLTSCMAFIKSNFRSSFSHLEHFGRLICLLYYKTRQDLNIVLG
ncbi:hypothetical protein VTN00DRAFT_1978 [Thermoascus crustaceus]|uniref:uncharacterized protein n=1 Tax=Thermoascus crustaceus TaxID=5088 RepID=UPI003743687D